MISKYIKATLCGLLLLSASISAAPRHIFITAGALSITGIVSYLFYKQIKRDMKQELRKAYKDQLPTFSMKNNVILVLLDNTLNVNDDFIDEDK